MPKISIQKLVSKYALIPQSRVDEVHALLFDPVRKKVRYGAWSALINQLLQEWVDKQHKEQKDFRKLQEERARG